MASIRMRTFEMQKRFLGDKQILRTFVSKENDVAVKTVENIKKSLTSALEMLFDQECSRATCIFLISQYVPPEARGEKGEWRKNRDVVSELLIMALERPGIECQTDFCSEGFDIMVEHDITSTIMKHFFSFGLTVIFISGTQTGTRRLCIISKN